MHVFCHAVHAAGKAIEVWFGDAMIIKIIGPPVIDVDVVIPVVVESIGY